MKDQADGMMQSMTEMKRRPKLLLKHLHSLLYFLTWNALNNIP